MAVPQNSHECNKEMFIVYTTYTHIHAHTKVLQLTSDIKGVHRELAVGAERHSDLQQKSEAQLRQVQVSSLFMYIYSNIPYLEDVTVGMVASVDRWWQAHRQGGLKGGSVKPPFWPPNDFIHSLTICQWSTSLTGIENERCPNEFGFCYAPCFFFLWRTNG